MHFCLASWDERDPLPLQQNCQFRAASITTRSFLPQSLASFLGFYLFCCVRDSMVIHKWHGSPIQTGLSWIEQEGKVLTHIKQTSHLVILTFQSGALTRPRGVGCSSPVFFHASPPSSGFLSCWRKLASAAHRVFGDPWVPTVDHT